MRLLDRYLLRELLVPLAYCLGGFLIFWIAFDLFNELGDFQEKGLKVLDVLEYYLVKTPEMLSTVLPVALLLALLYALTNHARYNELTAIRAAGTSLWRLSSPYLAVGFLFSLVLLAISEVWVPKSMDRLEQILNRHRKMATDQGWKSDLHFYNEAERRTWVVGTYNLNTMTFSNLNVIWRFPTGAWRNIYADNGTYSNGVWIFSGVQSWNYDAPNSIAPPPTITPMERFTFSESPDLIRSEIKINNLTALQAVKRPQLSIPELQEYFRLHPKLTDKQAALLYTQFHGRLAAPWTCLVVVLIALPFGAPSGRRNVFVGVAASIFICFIYFILLRLGLTLGTGGQLPAWMAAWLPNLFFAFTGIVLTCRVR